MIKARIDMLSIEELIRFWLQAPEGAFSGDSVSQDILDYLKNHIIGMKKESPAEWRIAQELVGYCDNEWMSDKARALVYLCDCKPKDCYHTKY